MLSLFVVGLSIKILDDYLDGDDSAGQPNLACLMDRGVVAYALFFYAVGAWLRPGWAFTLFLASYATGMLGSSHWILPSGFPAWVEVVVALVLGLCLAGWHELLSSVVLIFGIQLWDDVLDRAKDEKTGLRVNLAQKWGVVEASLAGLALLTTAVLLAPLKMLLTCLVLPLVLHVARYPWGKEGSV
ncbi:MAG: hypothetical protein ACOX2S_03885 [bacterium]